MCVGGGGRGGIFLVCWGCWNVCFLASFHNLSSLSRGMCYECFYEKEIVQRGMHLLPHPFIMPSLDDQSLSSSTISTDIPLDSFKLSSSSHSLTRCSWECFQEKLIILYYSWIEQKGSCGIFLCFLSLYLPKVLVLDEFLFSPVKYLGVRLLWRLPSSH